MNATPKPDTIVGHDRLASYARKLLAKNPQPVNSTDGAGFDKVSLVRYLGDDIVSAGNLAGKNDSPPLEPMAPKRKPVDLGHRLRQAILRSGLTRNQIARQTGLSYGVIHGFMAGTKDLLLGTASRMATVLGLDLSELGNRPRSQGSIRTKQSGARRKQAGH